MYYFYVVHIIIHTIFFQQKIFWNAYPLFMGTFYISDCLYQCFL